jgi:hypothetical protein
MPHTGPGSSTLADDMALADALRQIEQSWPDVEPRLTVAELYRLAEARHGRGPAPVEASEHVAATIIETVGAALPPEHDVWDALRASTRRYAPEPVVPVEESLLQLGALVDETLLRPETWLDGLADAGSDWAISAIRDEGFVEAGEIPGLDAPAGLLRVPAGDGMVYPSFQFRPEQPVQPHQLIVPVNEHIGADRDPWGAAAWWLTGNRWLSARPADLLGTDREPEILYAAEQLDNDNW